MFVQDHTKHDNLLDSKLNNKKFTNTLLNKKKKLLVRTYSMRI